MEEFSPIFQKIILDLLSSKNFKHQKKNERKKKLIKVRHRHYNETNLRGPSLLLCEGYFSGYIQKKTPTFTSLQHKHISYEVIFRYINVTSIEITFLFEFSLYFSMKIFIFYFLLLSFSFYYYKNCFEISHSFRKNIHFVFNTQIFKKHKNIFFFLLSLILLLCIRYA